MEESWPVAHGGLGRNPCPKFSVELCHVTRISRSSTLSHRKVPTMPKLGTAAPKCDIENPTRQKDQQSPPFGVGTPGGQWETGFKPGR